MRSLILVAVALIAAATAHARFARSSLEETVARTEAILDIQITSVHTQDWESSEGIATCGYTYEARVNDTLKGSSQGAVTFASPEGFLVGGRYVLFLDSYAGDFPTDVRYRRPPDEEARRQACLASLPDLKASWLHWGKFLPNDFVELSYWLVPPDEASPAEISIESVRTRGEVVEFRGPIDKRAPEVDALFYEHWLESTVVPWAKFRQSIQNATSGKSPDGSP